MTTLNTLRKVFDNDMFFFLNRNIVFKVFRVPSKFF